MYRMVTGYLKCVIHMNFMTPFLLTTTESYTPRFCIGRGTEGQLACFALYALRRGRGGKA